MRINNHNTPFVLEVAVVRQDLKGTVTGIAHQGLKAYEQRLCPEPKNQANILGSL